MLFDALMMESHQPPHAYARWGHPTAQMLEKVAALEGGEAALASGMAAVSAVTFTFLVHLE